ncbi:hypothetical protein SEA_CRANJIS_16 [Microbacterium phage Cranjis]|nr:hypothetical protein SEA_CRANJIS_16 [Microbacterium phage Cranjis]
MTLWSARNGYMGYGAVAALVEADTEEEARALASKALAEAGPDYERYGDIVSIREVTLPFVGDELP